MCWAALLFAVFRYSLADGVEHPAFGLLMALGPNFAMVVALESNDNYC
jgi:hypothetical protein